MRNIFKGLDLIDRVPDELWTEVWDIVQETGIKTVPMEKKCKKAKWLSEEALQIAVKRREAEGCLFTLLIFSFVVQNLLILIRSHLFIFAFISRILGGGS